MNPLDLFITGPNFTPVLFMRALIHCSRKLRFSYLEPAINGLSHFHFQCNLIIENTLFLFLIVSVYSILNFYSLTVIINAAFIFLFAKKLFNSAPSRGSNGERCSGTIQNLNFSFAVTQFVYQTKGFPTDKRVEHPSVFLLDPCLAP